MNELVHQPNPLRISWWDRFLISVAPDWGIRRVRARATAQLAERHYEAASIGHRTSGWSRSRADANAATSGATLSNLRAQSRDLVRNNPWARRGLRRITANTISWGIRPKATGRGADRVMARWKLWADTTQCDAAGRLTFYGLQRLVMRTVVESGEALIRLRWRRPEDGLAIPMQLQVLEPDFLDTGKDGPVNGGKIIQGIEFDMLGRRVAYWLFDQHPGGSYGALESRRIPADSILHVYDQERAGQVRGVPWFASVDVRLHEFDEFEDATLLKQKIAACMAAFVTDVDGTTSPLGKPGTTPQGALTDGISPGMILSLPPGRNVTVANPPTATDHTSFSATSLRGVAAGMGVTYEDLTGDYSQVNYSSARMARTAHHTDVHDWRWNMIIPQFCAPAWAWMINALILDGEDVENAPAEWTEPPLPMLDPDKEGAATSRAVRNGQMTHDAMVREQGYDPEDFWREYSESLKRLDKYGIVLDSDPRHTTTSGQLQQESSSSASSSDGTQSSASSADASTAAADGSAAST